MIVKLRNFDLGNFDDDTLITYDTDTEGVYGSCSATLNGENYILGGWNKKRQVNTTKTHLYLTKFYR